MAKGKDKPTKQTKKPKSDKPKGSGSRTSRKRQAAERASSKSRVVDLSEFIGRAARDDCRGIVSYGVAGALCPYCGLATLS